jgi:hypothetical protein
VLLIALCALVIRHVFDDGNRRDFKLVKHLNTLDNIDIGQFLWGSHDDCCVKVNFLCKGKLDVTCTWREIDNEVVKLPPVSVPNHLGHQAGYDGASHYACRVAF